MTLRVRMFDANDELVLRPAEFEPAGAPTPDFPYPFRYVKFRNVKGDDYSSGFRYAVGYSVIDETGKVLFTRMFQLPKQIYYRRYGHHFHHNS
jgi:hypothetical protein